MRFCRRDFSGLKPTDVAGKYQLCEYHFEPSQFMDPNLKGSNKKCKRLIHCALPTIFDVSNCPKPITIKRKLPNRHDLPPPSPSQKSTVCLYKLHMIQIYFSFH